VLVPGIIARHQAALSPQEVGLPPMPMRSSHLPRTALYESWNRLGLPRAESILPGAQLIHATTWALPPTSLPLVVTVHDLAFLRSPEHFTARGNAYFSRCLERVIAEASAIVVPSQATADDCIAAGIDAARLYVIPHGVRTRTVTDEQVRGFRATRGLTRDYVLWTGTREPRKNLLGLLRAFALLIEEHDDAGGLDLVVSNAGIVRAGSVLEQDASAFRLSTDINYVAFFLVTKHLGQLLARQHSTAPEWLTDIIQINSKSGLVGSNKNAAYAGSKFGGIGLVQSFALELVAHGVKVNAICPGNFYDGPLWSDPDRGLFVQYLNSGKVPGAKTVADVKEFYEAKVPMRRGAQGIDVLRAIFYIVEQEYETGQAVPVTGGQVMLS